MIYEYALEPKLVAKWCQNPSDVNFFKNNFGIDNGRMVAGYPTKKEWKKEVAKEVAKLPKKGIVRNQGAYTTFINLLQGKQLFVEDFGRGWNPSKSWLNNAKKANSSYQFHGALCDTGVPPPTNFASGSGVKTAPTPPSFWSANHSRVTSSIADKAFVLKPMMRCATEFIFVDPNFEVALKDHREFLCKLLSIINNRPSGCRIKLECHISANNESLNLFTCGLRLHRHKIIPKSFKFELKFSRWKTFSTSNSDSYIRTDIGGVVVRNSYVSRLTSAQFRDKKKEDGDFKKCFDLEKEVIVDNSGIMIV